MNEKYEASLWLQVSKTHPVFSTKATNNYFDIMRRVLMKIDKGRDEEERAPYNELRFRLYQILALRDQLKNKTLIQQGEEAAFDDLMSAPSVHQSMIRFLEQQRDQQSRTDLEKTLEMMTAILNYVKEM